MNTSLVRMATLQLVFTTIIQVRESQEDDSAHLDVLTERNTSSLMFIKQQGFEINCPICEE